MLYNAQETLYDALQCCTMLYKALQTLYNALWCSTVLFNGFYNALQCSTILQNAPKHQMVLANAITSGNLPGTFREPSGNLPGISWKPSIVPLETVWKSLGIFQERLPLSVSTSGTLPGRLPDFLPGFLPGSEWQCSFWSYDLNGCWSLGGPSQIKTNIFVWNPHMALGI